MTAGEYSLYFKHKECLELMLTLGASETVDKMMKVVAVYPERKRLKVVDEGFRWGYLKEKASYNSGGSLVDNQGMPVMMPWEAQLMKAHAVEMRGAKHPMNIGFGSVYPNLYRLTYHLTLFINV